MFDWFGWERWRHGRRYGSHPIPGIPLAVALLPDRLDVMLHAIVNPMGKIEDSRAKAEASPALQSIHRGYALARFERGKDLLGLGVHGRELVSVAQEVEQTFILGKVFRLVWLCIHQ